MTNEIEKIIKEAADKIARIKGKEYAPTSNEIQDKIDDLEKGKVSPVEWFAKEDGKATIDFLEGKLSQIELAVKKSRIFEQAKQMEKKKERQQLIGLLDWMNKVAANNPMAFETDHDDIVDMYLNGYYQTNK